MIISEQLISGTFGILTGVVKPVRCQMWLPHFCEWSTSGQVPVRLTNLPFWDFFYSATY